MRVFSGIFIDKDLRNRDLVLSLISVHNNFVASPVGNNVILVRNLVTNLSYSIIFNSLIISIYFFISNSEKIKEFELEYFESLSPTGYLENEIFPQILSCLSRT